jgi:flagellar hook-length control protein FliK
LEFPVYFLTSLITVGYSYFVKKIDKDGIFFAPFKWVRDIQKRYGYNRSLHDMPQTTSLAHILAPVKTANQAAGNLKSYGEVHKSKPNRPDLMTDGENVENPSRSVHTKGRRPDDFDKVLSRKIDERKEPTPDEHSQENTTSTETPDEYSQENAVSVETPDEYSQENVASVETGDFNLTQHMCCSAPDQGNNPLENTDGQSTPEQPVAEVSNPLNNADTIQLAANTGVMGETMNPVNQTNGQPSEQSQETTVQSTVPREEPVSVKITAEAELPVDEKQVPAPKMAMTVSADVSRDNDIQNNTTESKQFQIPEAAGQMPKQQSDESDLEIRPVRADQDKSIHPDLQAVLRSSRQEQQQGFRSQPENSDATGQFQDETQDIKDPKVVPFEAETFIDEQDGISKGFEIRNTQSVLHSADPAENASLSALEAPARTGVHSNIQQDETIKPVDQILQHLNSISVSGPQQRIKLTLTPEHLGTIRITFNQTEGEVIGLLEVQKNQTRRDVEQSLPQLISAMQSSGVQVRRIEVVQWNAGQDNVGDGTAKESDYSAADQFGDGSSSNSSESEVLRDARSARDGQESTQFSQVSEKDGPIYNADITEGGLNMFI